MMNQIGGRLPFASVIEEIDAQKKDLPDYLEYLASSSVAAVKPERMIFVGAGDSLATAEFIERLMDFEPRSFDPYDLIQNPNVAKDKSVYIISISGRTKANIEAASRISRIAREVVATTANVESELARVCTRVLPLKFRKSPGLTPGTNSFTASLLGASSIFGNLPKQLDAAQMIERAKNWVSGISEPSGTIHFVGSGIYYPVALYGYAKVCEFTGGSADYQLVEEFSHMNLFSMREKDSIFILRDGVHDEKASILHETLSKSGITSSLLSFEEKYDKIEQAIFYSIQLQHLALNIALKKGLIRPAFLDRTDLLRISDKMIY
ncbi:MAG: hypothetical protein OK439_04900 [Thaumarchaeota archaeon]|nr:hypothetical protein [Nitrososphaerota archaeon]